MIQFFASDNHVETMDRFVASWSPESDSLIRRMSYEKIAWRRPLRAGACIFADLERLLPLEYVMVRQMADEIRSRADDFVMLNDPALYLGRFRLLQTLHARGNNLFRAFRLHDVGPDLRFPVFLRRDSDHRGPLEGMIYSFGELERRIASLSWPDRFLRHRLMIVEYCDCSDSEGLFRKYSVMNIHGTLIPRHVLFSRHWVTKEPEIVNQSTIGEEEAFLENPPYLNQISHIFRLAGITYGRIDYGVKNEQVQTWEINTNPVLVPLKEKIHSDRFSSQARSAELIIRELRNLACSRGNRTVSTFRSRKKPLWPVIQILVRKGRPCWRYTNKRIGKVKRIFSPSSN